MIGQRLQRLAHAGKHFEELHTIARHSSRFFRQTRNKHVGACQDFLTTNPSIIQRFVNNLQVSHPRHTHLGQTPGRSEDLLEHGNRVLLVPARPHRMNQRTVNVPKEYAHHSTTASTSPAFTVSPGFTLVDTTVPSRGDFISFCIFIASTTITPAPFSTVAPTSVCTRTTLPGIGARTSATP